MVKNRLKIKEFVNSKKYVAIIILCFILIVAGIIGTSYSATLPNHERSEYENAVVRTALSYLYNQTYTDYEEYSMTDKAQGIKNGTTTDLGTTFGWRQLNYSPEEINRGNVIGIDCSGFVSLVYMKSLGYDFSEYWNDVSEDYKYVYNNGKFNYVRNSQDSYKDAYTNYGRSESTLYFMNLAKHFSGEAGTGNGTYYNSPYETHPVVFYYDVLGNENNDTKKTITDAFFKALRPGDLVVYRYGPNANESTGGHVVMYVGKAINTKKYTDKDNNTIDLGGFVHSTGNDINYNSSTDKFSNTGFDYYSVRYNDYELVENNLFYNNGSADDSKMTTSFAILRPINVCRNERGSLTARCDEFFESANVKARTALSGMKIEEYASIDKCIDDSSTSCKKHSNSLSQYNSINRGDTITYTTELTNNSIYNYCSNSKYNYVKEEDRYTDKDSCTSNGAEWITGSGSGHDFTGKTIVVTSDLPSGTTFDSWSCEYNKLNGEKILASSNDTQTCSGNCCCTFSNSKLTCNINNLYIRRNPYKRESVKIDYKVKTSSNTGSSVTKNGSKISYNGEVLTLGQKVTKINPTINNKSEDYFASQISAFSTAIKDGKIVISGSSKNNYATYFSDLESNTPISRSEFPKMIYYNEFGVDLDFLTKDNVKNAVFKQINSVQVQKTRGDLTTYTTYTVNDFYTKKTTAEINNSSDDYKKVNRLVVKGMYGGRKLHGNDTLDRMKYLRTPDENRLGDLEYGDIIFAYKDNVLKTWMFCGRDSDHVAILKYFSDEHVLDSKGNDQYGTISTVWNYQLRKLWYYDLFVVIRPTQYYSTTINLEYNGATSGMVGDNYLARSKYKHIDDIKPSKVYTVTYNSQKKDVSPATVTNTLEGWYSDANFSNKVTSDSSLVSSSSHTLYAKYKTASVTLPNPQVKGYEVTGWYSDSSYTNKVGNPGATYTPTKSLTLYAKWAPKTYSITLNNQGATSTGTTKVYYQYNTTQTINGVKCYYYSDSTLTTCLSSGYNIVKPTKDGYAFGGYYSGTNGSGTQYVGSDSSFMHSIFTYTPSDINSSYTTDIILYAKWNPYTYSIVLDNQGATSSGTTKVYYQYKTTKTIDGVKCYYYSDSTLTTCLSSGYNIVKPQYNGYTFGGYYTGKNGSGVQYVSSGGSFMNSIYYKLPKEIDSSFTSTITLYANKVGDGTYKVNYYLGNATSTTGSSKIGESTCTAGVSCKLKTFTELGGVFPYSSSDTTRGNKYWEFYGWTKSMTGNTRTYADGASVTLSSNIDLYAVGRHPIIFYSGVNPTSALSTLYQYWNARSTAESFRTTITVPAATDIDAWTFKGYLVGSNSIDGSITLSPSVVNKTINPEINNSGYYRSVYSRVLTVNYNSNGGTGTLASSTLTQYYNSGYGKGGVLGGNSITLKNNAFEKSGSSFSKWAAGSTSGTEYSQGATYTALGSTVQNATTSTTMYAKWQNHVTAPTASTYCNNPTYNGQTQSLVKSASTGFTWSGSTTGKDAKTYTVTAKVSSGYVWSNSNGSTEDKTIECSIKPKTLIITADDQTITYGDSIDTGVSSASASGLASGDSLSGVTLVPSTDQVTTSGKIKPSSAVIKRDSIDITNNYSITYSSGSLTIKPLEKYEVIFNSNGGSSVSRQLVEKGSTVYEPTNPIRTGYNFEAWYSNSNLTDIYNFNTPVYQTLTLYAKWTKQTYQVTFNSNGGSSVASQSISYEGTVTKPSNPTRTGYTFAGWYTNSNYNTQYDFSKKVTSALILYAKWNETKYSISYILNGGHAVNPTQYTINTPTFALEIPTREGYRFKGWTGSNGGEPQTSVIVAKGSTGNKVYKAVYSPITYNVQFNTNGGNNIANQEVNYAALTTEPITPSREGYAFAGWYTDPELTNKYEFNTKTYSDKTLYANWISGKSQITYNLNGGIAVNPTYYDENTSQFTLDNPEKEGSVFIGWTGSNGNTPQMDVTVNPSEISNISHIYEKTKYKVVMLADSDDTGDLNYTANYTENTYTISFNYEGLSDITKVYGEPITLPIPEKEGYTFVGWYRDAGLNEEFTEETMPAENITLYPRFEGEAYQLLFNTNGGNVIEPIEILYDEDIPTLPTPEKEGYSFVGWYSDAELSNEFDLEKMPASNVRIYAKWQGNTYTVTFNTNGGSSINDVIVIHGDRLSRPSDPTRSGYTFGNWYSDDTFDTLYDFDDEVTSDLVLYATWEVMNYTIDYDLKGGEVEYNPTNYNTLTETFTLNEPEKEGYTFTGWTGSNGTTPQRNITIQTGSVGNRNYTANYNLNMYKITFNTNDGSSVSPITAGYGTIVDEPESPTKSGYRFAGWYSDSSLNSLYSFTTMPAENITLYAKWTSDTYIISYELNGGINNESNATSYNVGEEIELRNPTKTGYTFAGWYTERNFEHRIDVISSDMAEDLTLYAKWDANTYTITFNMNGAEEIPSIDKSYGSSLSITSPTRTGYTFAGWYEDELFTIPFELTEMPAHDLALYAKWNANTYTISFNSNGGNEINSITAEYDSDIIEPNQPLKKGYKFAGWYSDKELTKVFSFSKMPAGNITLYAKWVDNSTSTIKYVLYGGKNSTKNKTSYKYGDTLKLYEPKKEGYEFLGWYLDSDYQTRIEKLTNDMSGDLTLYARWKPLESIKVPDTGSETPIIAIIAGITLISVGGYFIVNRKTKLS